MSERERGRQVKESEQEFANRVLERTGVALDKMQEGTEDELIGSHIFCRRDNVWVVATGYPSRVEEDGGEFWDDPACYRKITLE